jgi:branched-chain amino acid transport system ATP-binding protein
MLIIEHDVRLIMRLCGRLHVLNHGKTIGEGAPEEIRRNPAVVAAYLGSPREGRNAAA